MVETRPLTAPRPQRADLPGLGRPYRAPRGLIRLCEFIQSDSLNFFSLARCLSRRDHTTPHDCKRFESARLAQCSP